MTSSRNGTLVITNTFEDYERLMQHEDSVDGCWSPRTTQGVVRFTNQATAQKAKEELL